MFEIFLKAANQSIFAEILSAKIGI